MDDTTLFLRSVKSSLSRLEIVGKDKPIYPKVARFARNPGRNKATLSDAPDYVRGVFEGEICNGHGNCELDVAESMR